MKGRSLFASIFLTAALAAGHAGASSIVELEAFKPAAGPSVDERDTATQRADAAGIAPVGEPVIISPSIIALGEPAVDASKTASVDSGRQARSPEPLVIRGGIYGGAFSGTVPVERPPQAEPTVQAEAPSRQEPEAPAQPPAPQIVPE